MKHLITLIIVLSLFSCSKEDKNVNPSINLAETSFYADANKTSGNLPYYLKLSFVNENTVEFSEILGHPNEGVISGDGVLQLVYTIENPETNSPVIRITGISNGDYAFLKNGDAVNWSISYNRGAENEPPYFYLKQKENYRFNKL
ncbi:MULTISPECIES: hypothetical protein [Olivibacter]|uniref:Uncharacterized protein n=1 Tax=Olivibacter jilunii TaxID=985016 RepID=A0ABW6AZD9_9SPHI